MTKRVSHATVLATALGPCLVPADDRCDAPAPAAMIDATR